VIGQAPDLRGGKQTATPGYAESGHLSQYLSSSSRRIVLLGVLFAVGALFYSVLERRDSPSRFATGGDFGVCSKQRGDAARACYRREVGRELAAVGNAAPAITRVAPAGTSTEVTFAEADVETSQQDDLLCDLHTRVGVTNEQVPSWLGWAEPLAETAPAS
jgi:hypothetical protein